MSFRRVREGMLETIKDFFTVEPKRDITLRPFNMLYLSCFLLFLTSTLSYPIFLTSDIIWSIPSIFVSGFSLMWIFLSIEEIVWEIFGVGLDEFLTISYLRELVERYREIGLSEYIEYKDNEEVMMNSTGSIPLLEELPLLLDNDEEKS